MAVRPKSILYVRIRSCRRRLTTKLSRLDFPLDFPLRELLLDLSKAVALKNYSHAPTRRWKEFDDMHNGLDTLRECDEQTDRIAKIISRSACITCWRVIKMERTLENSVVWSASLTDVFYFTCGSDEVDDPAAALTVPCRRELPSADEHESATLISTCLIIIIIIIKHRVPYDSHKAELALKVFQSCTKV